MICLEDVYKSFPTPEGRHVVLNGITTAIPTNRSVGILGGNGAGKSTLLRLIAGADRPTSGHITTTSRLSWPMAFGGGFVPKLSAIDNIRFVSRIYGVDWKKSVDFVEDFAELGKYLHAPVKDYSAGMRARLNMAMSFAIRFDVYLLDEIPGVIDAKFKSRFSEAFEKLREKSSLILVSHNAKSIKQYCDSAYILQGGSMTFYDNVDEALEVYKAA